MRLFRHFGHGFCGLAFAVSLAASESALHEEALQTMKRATTYMVEKVSVRGGYVWSYLPDFSRRWGELEAGPKMIWIQSPGTVHMGHVFLDAYHATGDKAYYAAAQSVTEAIIVGQLPCGGWNYVVDFAGEASLRKWYDTIGKNAWRLEEYHRYHGNATFDDGTTAHATLYLLRFYLEHRDAAAKAALDRAIQFVLDAQQPNGGWPQRFPVAPKADGKEDYTQHITFNDGVTAGNVDLLLRCYQVLRDERLVEPIRRGMQVFVATLGQPPQAGWSLQHRADLQPAGARGYEPRALATHTTAANIRHLLNFYRVTGDPTLLARVPDALQWLESARLPPDLPAAGGATHPTFVELGTNRPLYLHRSGSNVRNGRYFANYDPTNTIGHYSSFRRLDVAGLHAEYVATKALEPDAATANSPLLHPDAVEPWPRYVTAREGRESSRSIRPSLDRVRSAIASLDSAGRWLTPVRTTSHPYLGDSPADIAPGDFAGQFVGDRSDTSPYVGAEPVAAISTTAFVRNLNVLISFVAP